MTRVKVDHEDHGEWFLYFDSGGRDLSVNKRTTGNSSNRSRDSKTSGFSRRGRQAASDKRYLPSRDRFLKEFSCLLCGQRSLPWSACLRIYALLLGLQSRKMVRKLDGHVDMIITVACHPTRSMFASSALEKSWTVKIWILTKNTNED